MTLKSLFARSIAELKKSGIAAPELDAKVLLLCAMEEKGAFVYSHSEYLVINAQYSKFRRYIRRRKKGEPVAYITGHKEFFGLDFLVNKNVLVPRPESEWLVEKGAELLSQLSVVSYQLSVLDMGTGSGCLIIALEKECEKQYNNTTIQQFYFCGADLSNSAVAVAKKNAKILNAENIVFLNSNLFGNRRIKNRIFDLVVPTLP